MRLLPTPRPIIKEIRASGVTSSAASPAPICSLRQKLRDRDWFDVQVAAILRR
jgi:hypothetical protein